MLKITRRIGERIILGEDIVVTLLEVSGQTARLGIDAPRSVPIFREEIWIEVKRENEAAAKAAASPLPDVAGSEPAAAGARPGVTVTPEVG